MAALRAGLVGLGMMGRHHARVLRSLAGVEIVGIADPGGDRHGAAAGVALHRRLDTLLAEGLDYAVVAVPTAQHEAVATRLAEARVHVLIEKPLAGDEGAARRIEATCDVQGVLGAVGHVERYNPSLQALRHRLQAGELGEIFQIATRRQGPFPARVADVGVVMDLATHDIDLTAWVGGAGFASVSARTAHRSGRDTEDLLAAVGTLDNGIVTSHLVNWLSPVKERSVMVTGERGALVADTLTADLTFFANGTVPSQWDSMATFRGVTEGDVIRYAISKPEPLLVQHEAFRDAVLGRPRDVVTLSEGVRTVTVATAVLAAATSGDTVNIPARSPVSACA